MRNPFAPHPPRRHRWDPRQGFPSAPAPPAPLDVVDVGCEQGYEFNWFIYWQFSGPLPPSLAVADLTGLTVGGVAPVSIDDRGTNWLILLHRSDDGAGAPWLVTPAGAPRFVPGQAGVVHEI